MVDLAANLNKYEARERRERETEREGALTKRDTRGGGLGRWRRASETSHRLEMRE